MATLASNGPYSGSALESSRGASERFSMDPLTPPYSDMGNSEKDFDMGDDKRELGLAMSSNQGRGLATTLDEKELNGRLEQLVGQDARTGQEFGRRTTTNVDVRTHVQAVMEQHDELTRPMVFFYLSMAYTVFILLLVLFSLGGQTAVHFLITDAYDDPVQLNAAGRVNKEVHILAKNALGIAYGREIGDIVAPFVNDSVKRLSDWTEYRQGLRYGNKQLGLPPEKSSKIKALFDSSDSSFDSVKSSSQAIIDLQPDTLQKSDVDAFRKAFPPCWRTKLYKLFAVFTGFVLRAIFRKLKEHVDVVVTNSVVFSSVMEDIIHDYEKRTHDDLKFILRVTWILEGVLLFILIVGGVFFIRPISVNIEDYVNERFNILRRSLEAEAESSGVSVLMMGYISHELQQPLACLKILLQDGIVKLHPFTMFLSDPRNDLTSEEVQAACRFVLDSLQQMQESCSLMSTIIGDVANMRQLELGRMSLSVDFIDVTEVVRQVVRTLMPYVSAGVSLEVDIHPSLGNELRQLDKHRLKQVLTNLVSNAISCTEFGIVAVRVGPSRLPQRLRFEVQDMGPGLTAEQRASAYEPTMKQQFTYETPNKEGEGVGLGLYIVKMLVELQSGSLGVESEVGKGSTFWFELPASSASQIGTNFDSGHLPYPDDMLPLENHRDDFQGYDFEPSSNGDDSFRFAWRRESWDQMTIPNDHPNHHHYPI